MSRPAKLTPQGIMVDTDQLHELGPVAGAIAMVASLCDNRVQFSSVRYDGRKIVHLVVEPTDGDLYVKCGLPAEGHATLWYDGGKRVNCKRCL